MDYKKFADMLFPDITLSVQDIINKYPKRVLNDGAQVTRYAPSPTGYMHIGNFFQMFISYNLAKQTEGTFYVRIEDTDSKREKKDATQVIYEILDKFNINIDEYQTLNGEDVGAYGPYVQSQRVNIYKAFAKELVAKGRAFPCFCKKTEGKEDVLELRKDKFLEDDSKEYDVCRDLSLEEVEKHLNNGDKFAIRLKTLNDGTQRVTFHDLIKGDIEAKANAKDFILLKNDGVPPYAFAHAIDDTLMGTTIVVRGEEYISSTPMHIELFEALGFTPTVYCHNPLICKIGDEGNRRKISKRYDPEADMRFYFEKGYPIDAVLEYLLNLINSHFETWRTQNPEKPWQDFKFGINDITTVAPIFDLVKLGSISKNIISKMTAQEVYNNTLNWAQEYDKDFAGILLNNKDFAIKVFNIDRDVPKPRKDIACFSEVKEYYAYMFNELLNVDSLKQGLQNACLNPEDNSVKFDKVSVKNVLNNYLESYNKNDEKQEWFDKIKQVSKQNGWADDMKEFKANPEKFKGSYGDVSTLIRVALTGKTQTPDLYYICNILGKQEMQRRIDLLTK